MRDDSKKVHIARVYQGRHLEYMAERTPRPEAKKRFQNDFMKNACKKGGKK